VTLVIVTILPRVVFLGVVLASGTTAIGPNAPDFEESNDGYVALARSLVETGRFAFEETASQTVHRGPAYPVAIAAAYYIMRSFTWATLLVNVLSSVVVTLAVYRITCWFYAERIAYVLALLASFYPVGLYYIGWSFADVFLAATFALYAWLMLEAIERDSLRWMIAGGLILGLSMLTKPILGLFPLVALAVAVVYRRTWLRWLVVQMLVMLVVVLPWSVRSSLFAGRPVYLTTGSGFNMLVGNFMIDHTGDCNSSFDGGVRDALAYVNRREGLSLTPADLATGSHLDLTARHDWLFLEHAIAHIRDTPHRFARKILVNLGRFWYFGSTPNRCILLGAINLPIVLLAGWEGWRRRRAMPDQIAALAILVGYTWLLYAAIIVHSRFYLTVIPLLLPFALARAGRIVGKMTVAPDHPADESGIAVAGTQEERMS
jgi:4-amino-4-deoxy-L-arabinose transferase-like glycosyltransferase